MLNLMCSCVVWLVLCSVQLISPLPFCIHTILARDFLLERTKATKYGDWLKMCELKLHKVHARCPQVYAGRHAFSTILVHFRKATKNKSQSCNIDIESIAHSISTLPSHFDPVLRWQRRAAKRLPHRFRSTNVSLKF